MKHKFLLNTLAACTLLGFAATPVFASETNPYSPANGHAYRHGVLPTRDVLNKMHQYESLHALAAVNRATGANTLIYGGGISGVGVMSTHVKVYLVFYGTQWGTQGTDSKGNATFTGDPSGVAPVTQMMFKGIGTGGELWSADLTQWCDGPNVATGATSCPSNASFVPYQTGGTLAGVWYDNSKASPAVATAAQLASEAVAAAAHFGNTAAGSNRDTYYVIMSPHGTNPDSYQGAYCAWHDYTTSSYGDMAYSNQPYNTDSGAGCGVNFVNSGSAGLLDGYTMTLGHEWHETMSDQFPAGGWTASSGQENSDECAWIAAGSPGGAANITMGNGTYTEQASWSNDTNSCAISHPIVGGGGGGGGTPVANFTFTKSRLVAKFTDTSTETGGTISAHSWTFGDGSSSTATNPSHTYAAAGTYSVTETVTDGVHGTSNAKTESVTVRRH
ncbi:MAG TPA: PKD domain-containing protein [Rhodanobacter sp.]|jgi:serine protease|nr:PKD domain-containing protein [Rhodanobacter sp.]